MPTKPAAFLAMPFLKPGQIRTIVICIVRRKGAILVSEGWDATKGETFYRPLGGAIEFGEHSSQAIIREMDEEINAGLTNLRYVGILENIFIYEGQPGHEIVLIYEADFADAVMYDKTTLVAKEDDGRPLKVIWKPIADFVSGQSLLYPDGLLALLTNE